MTERVGRTFHGHELAALLGINYRTVHRAVRSGQLRATQQRRHGPWQITEADASRWAGVDLSKEGEVPTRWTLNKPKR